MEFSVNKTDLVRELSLSQGVVERKTTIPILSNILIEAFSSIHAVVRPVQNARPLPQRAAQRPSVDVLTGIIKANFPARVACKVFSKVDSRTILDTNGAESLLGYGDMLFLSPGVGRLQRLHGPFVSEGEIKRIVEFLKQQGTPSYQSEILEEKEEEENGEEMDDEKYREAVEFVMDKGEASISMVQRRFRIGYNRAARIIERMERDEIVGPSDGVKPREVLKRR